jgi:alkylation response protein AidB-like acyl-CoA dehydrogenase
MIDFSLTQEQQILQTQARDFAQNDIEPIVRIIEESNNPEIEPWDFCKSLFDKGSGLGFTSLMLPKELGGRGCNCIDLAIVLEEIGAVDVSIACSYFNLNAAMSLFVTRVATRNNKNAYYHLLILKHPICLAPQKVSLMSPLLIYSVQFPTLISA